MRIVGSCLGVTLAQALEVQIGKLFRCTARVTAGSDWPHASGRASQRLTKAMNLDEQTVTGGLNSSVDGRSGVEWVVIGVVQTAEDWELEVWPDHGWVEASSDLAHKGRSSGKSAQLPL